MCQVEHGGGAPLQIVCGAANARAGLKAPLAIVGAKLPGGMKIKAAKLRGVESAGMLCSAKELGLADDVRAASLELPADAPVGSDAARLSAARRHDPRTERHAEPRRCHVGAGRRARSRALLQAAQAADARPRSPRARRDAATRFRCARCAGAAARSSRAASMRGIDNRGASPLWMRERLRRAGLRAISPVVDVTNYVMLELGQPMHAYDLAALQGALDRAPGARGRDAHAARRREIELTADVLVIADDDGPVGLAGVMGGAAHGDHRRDDRRTARGRVLRARRDRRPRAPLWAAVTDASQRFERGVDPQLQERAIERATALLLAIAAAARPVPCRSRRRAGSCRARAGVRCAARASRAARRVHRRRERRGQPEAPRHAASAPRVRTAGW